MSNTTFKYFCRNCGAPAWKEPLKAHAQDEPALGTLGSWRCTKDCKGKVAVRRERAQ